MSSIKNTGWSSLLIVVCCSLFTAQDTTAFLSPASLSFSSNNLLLKQQQQQQQQSSSLFMARGGFGGGRKFRGRQPTVQDNRPVMNEEITHETMRVVAPTEDGKDKPLGVLNRQEALDKAKEMGDLDLILVNANSDPPVCKIVDYSKYRYMQEKKAKEVKKKSKATEIKEVKMSYKIDVHDYGVRKKAAEKFLLKGDRVKCTVMFRGREVQHEQLGFDLLDKLAVDLEKTCIKESPRAKKEGRNLSLILSPKAEVLKAVNEKRRLMEKNKKKNKRAAFEERKAKLAMAGGAAAAAAQDGGAQAEDEQYDSDDDDDDDDDDDIEISLDDLLGSDEYVDDLFK